MRAWRTLRNFVNLFLVPGLLALLPWRIGFRVLRWLSRWDRLYRPELDAVSQGMTRAGLPPPTPSFLRLQRFLRLVDHCDLYLSNTRSDRFLKRHVEVVGDWPDAPFLAATFHWGLGFWALRHLSASRGPVWSLSIDFDRQMFAHEPLGYRYAAMRINGIGRACRQEVTLAGVGMRRLRRALANGQNILGLVDVPGADPKASCEVQLLGRPARFPTGLLRIAQSAGVPVVPFWMDIDIRSGHRRLHIGEALPSDDLDRCASTLAGHLNQRLAETPEYWHLWSQAHGFFPHG